MKPVTACSGPVSGVASNTSTKAPLRDFARVVPPATTLQRVRPAFDTVGITRVANLTGLDRIGIPVVAVIRPNSRSYSVAQGKGLTLDAAKASGVMESIENFHAESLSLPLRLGSARELQRTFALPDMGGLPRLATSPFRSDHPLLWVEGGFDLVSGGPVLLPYELVHLDLRVPHPQGTGCFLISSNGLASGNHIFEAISHALCEVIERDANTLWQLSGEGSQRTRRIDLHSVDDPACRALLASFDAADIDVLAWNTTTDVGVASVLCDVVDRYPDAARPMPPVRGSGTHPCRRIALSRALTEAAQGRLTRISGSRDDLFSKVFDDSEALRMAAVARARLSEPTPMSFDQLPDLEHQSVEDDAHSIGEALQAAGFSQIIAMNLTRADLEIPVVRVVVPHLESMSDLPGYVPGVRARRALESAQ